MQYNAVAVNVFINKKWRNRRVLDNHIGNRMAVTVKSFNGSSLMLSKFLKPFALSLNLDHGCFYTSYKIIVVLLMTISYIAGMYFKLEDCALTTVILRYLDLLLVQTRFMLNAIDLTLPFLAKDNISVLTELLDTTNTSHKKVILSHALLNYCFIIIQLLFYGFSMCNYQEFCNPYCLLPHFISYTLTTVGFFRCYCILYLLKQRVFEVSQDLSNKLSKIGVTESVNVIQVDEILGGIQAYGRCFGIQLALQFVDFESVVVENVVLLKKVLVDLPLAVYLLMLQRTISAAVSWE